MHEGSGWSVHSILEHWLVTSEIAPCKGSSYFQLPKELGDSMKGLIIVHNQDDQCLRYCLVRYLNPPDKNRAITRNIDR